MVKTEPKTAVFLRTLNPNRATTGNSTKIVNKFEMHMRPVAIWRDEVKAAVNTRVGNDATIDTCLSIHVLFISQVNVFNKWLPTTTADSSATAINNSVHNTKNSTRQRIH